MNSSNDLNSVYSRSDKSKVNLSEAEWEKILPADVFYVARKKGTERPWSSKLENLMKRAFIIARLVVTRFLEATPNLKAGAGGPVFTNRLAVAVLFMHRITLLEWKEPK